MGGEPRCATTTGADHPYRILSFRALGPVKQRGDLPEYAEDRFSCDREEAGVSQELAPVRRRRAARRGLLSWLLHDLPDEILLVMLVGTALILLGAIASLLGY